MSIFPDKARFSATVLNDPRRQLLNNDRFNAEPFRHSMKNAQVFNAWNSDAFALVVYQVSLQNESGLIYV